MEPHLFERIGKLKIFLSQFKHVHKTIHKKADGLNTRSI